MSLLYGLKVCHSKQHDIDDRISAKHFTRREGKPSTNKMCSNSDDIKKSWGIMAPFINNFPVVQTNTRGGDSRPFEHRPKLNIFILVMAPINE